MAMSNTIARITPNIVACPISRYNLTRVTSISAGNIETKIAGTAHMEDFLTVSYATSSLLLMMCLLPLLLPSAMPTTS
jgi:hypothetical protein